MDAHAKPLTLDGIVAALAEGRTIRSWDANHQSLGAAVRRRIAVCGDDCVIRRHPIGPRFDFAAIRLWAATAPTPHMATMAEPQTSAEVSP